MDKFFIRKDVYEELLEKGFGKKDYSKLTKKVITDKNGHRRTVFVKNSEQPAEVKQPTAQKELSPEKRARYEEMLEKVKNGPDEYALFVSTKGMLNKKDAIAHLEAKLGKRTGNNDLSQKQKDNIKNDYENLMARKKDGYADKVKKQGYDYQELKETGKLPDGLSAKALREIRDRAKKDGFQDENTNNLVLAAQERLDELSRENYAKKQAKNKQTEEYKENYLDARNEGGKDIADENRVDSHSKNAINLSDSEVKKMQKLFDYIPENAKGVQIMNTIYDEDKELYKKLSDMDVEYKKLHPEAEGKTFSFDLATKYLEDSFNEYKKDHEVGKDKFAEMTVEDIRKEQQNLLDDYNQYYNAYKNGKNDGSKLREYFKKFDVYKTALDKKSKE